MLESHLRVHVILNSGFPHPHLPALVSGELPKAFLVRRGDVMSEELKQFVASKVPPDKKLRVRVEFVEKIPKSASGKILRRLLRKQEQEKSRL